MTNRCATGLGTMAAWAVLAAGLPSAWAQVGTWLGTVDTNWANAANWTGGIVPGTGASNSVCVFVSNGANNPLYYTAAQGDSVFNNGTASGSSRPLRIGDGTAGTLVIAGGSIETRGPAADLIGNGAGGNATLIIDGGRYIATNASPILFGNGGIAATLTVNSGTGMVATLQGGTAATATINLNGGLLQMTRFTTGAGMAGIVNFNGGTLRTYASDQTDWMPTNATYNVLAGGAILEANNNVGIRGPMGGVGAVTKNGGSNLTLSGSNTYAGVTTVNSGALLVGSNTGLGSTNGGTVVKSGALVQLLNGVTVTGEAITLSGTGGNNVGALQAGVNATSTWAGAVFLNDNGGTAGPRIGARLTGVLTVSGVIANGAAGSTLYIAGEGTTGRVILSGANTYTGATGIVRGILALGVDNTLPLGTTLSLNAAVITGDASTFDLNGHSQTVAQLVGAVVSNSQPMTITNTVPATQGTLTVNQSANTVYPGTIGGNVALVKGGPGLLTVSNATAYTGPTTLNAGTLLLVAANGAPGGSAVTINGGTFLLGTTNALPGTLAFTDGNNAEAIGPSYALDQGFMDWVSAKAAGTVPVVAMGADSANPVSFAGALAGTFLGGAGAVAVTNTGGATWGDTTLRLGGGSGTLVYAGPIGGATNVVIGPVGGNNASVVALPATQTYTGGTTINSGALLISGDASLGAPPAAATPGSVVINSGTLMSSASDMNIDARRGFAIGTNGAAFSPAGGGVLRIHGIVADLPGQAGLLVATNAGVLVLDGVNTYTGGTVLLPGSQIAIQGNQPMGTGPVTLTGGTLRATSSATIPTFVSNSVLLAADSSIGGNNARSLTFLGPITIAGATRTLTMAGNDSATFAGPVGDGGSGYGLVKAGSSTLTMSGANSTYSGGTTVSGGVLAMGTNNPFGTGTVTLNGGTLRASGAARTLTNAVQVNAVAGNTLDAAGGDLSLFGNLGGAGSVTKSGGAALQLWGDNAGFSGTVSNTSGYVWFDQASAGSAAARWVLASTNAFAINLDNAGSGARVSLGALSGVSGSVVRAGGTQAGLVTFVVGDLGLDTEFAGSFQDSPSPFTTGAVVKVGAGTLTLSGTSTHKGGTVVSNGTLAVNGSLGGLTTVASGATLRGTGTVASLIMSAGSTFAPGNSIGTMHVSGALTLSGNTSVFELASVADHDLTVIGAGGSLTLENQPLLQLDLTGFSANTNDVIVLFDNQFSAAPTLTDTFWLDGTTPLTNNAEFSPDGGTHAFRINYDAGTDNNDITLTVVPEPGSLGIFGLLSLALLARRRLRG